MDEHNIDFIIFIMYKLSAAWNMPVRNVYALLNGTGTLEDYFIPCYDVLHTLGSEYLVEDITGYVRERGGFV